MDVLFDVDEFVEDVTEAKLKGLRKVYLKEVAHHYGVCFSATSRKAEILELLLRYFDFDNVFAIRIAQAELELEQAKLDYLHLRVKLKKALEDRCLGEICLKDESPCGDLVSNVFPGFDDVRPDSALDEIPGVELVSLPVCGEDEIPGDVLPVIEETTLPGDGPAGDWTDVLTETDGCGCQMDEASSSTACRTVAVPGAGLDGDELESWRPGGCQREEAVCSACDPGDRRHSRPAFQEGVVVGETVPYDGGEADQDVKKRDDSRRQARTFRRRQCGRRRAMPARRRAGARRRVRSRVRHGGRDARRCSSVPQRKSRERDRQARRQGDHRDADLHVRDRELFQTADTELRSQCLTFKLLDFRRRKKQVDVS